MSVRLLMARASSPAHLQQKGMITGMRSLSPALQTVPVCALVGETGHICLIEGRQNEAGCDIMLLFSTQDKAQQYADGYAGFRSARTQPTTITKLIDRFQGRVESDILDRSLQGHRNGIPADPH